MTENCYNIGTIQAFLDGELAPDKLESVSRHIAVCDDCAITLAEAEEETAFAFTVLEREFNALVPTNRLWTKINASIEKEKKPFWQTVYARFSNSSMAAFASLLIIAGLFAVLFMAKRADKIYVAENISGNQIEVSPISNANLPVQSDGKTELRSDDVKIEKASNIGGKANKYDIVKADFSKKTNARLPVKTQKAKLNVERNPSTVTNVEARDDANLLGEENYVKTIAALTKTVDGSKDEVLKSAARFAFERDLAVTDDAIKKMKAEVARNPKNEAAKDVLRASYQNKIDLLNSVAEKSELMASLK